MLKKMYLAAGLVVLGLALSACRQGAKSKANPSATGATAAYAAAKEDPTVLEEVKSLLFKHDSALNNKDIEALLTTFSYDPRTVVLGTGEGERYVGRQAIKEAYTEIFKDYDAGTLVTNCDWKTGGVDPAATTAWVAATCPAHDSLKAVKRSYVLNVSGALKRDDSGWHFIMLHMSNATSANPGVAANTKSVPAR